MSSLIKVNECINKKLISLCCTITTCYNVYGIQKQMSSLYFRVTYSCFRVARIK